jgi:hypothetical protein
MVPDYAVMKITGDERAEIRRALAIAQAVDIVLLPDNRRVVLNCADEILKGLK